MSFNVFFYFFPRFSFVEKNVVKCEVYEYARIQRKILSEDALAMIFIDFGLLRIARTIPLASNLGQVVYSHCLQETGAQKGVFGT